MTATHEIDWGALEANLDEARRWMKRKQDPGAIMSHLGRSAYVGGGLYMHVAPGKNYNAHPDGNVTMWFSLETQNYGEHDEWTPPPYDAETLARLRKTIEKVFPKIVDSWNGGVGSTSVSYQVRADVSGIIGTVENYLRGCPVHHGPFCWGDDSLHPGKDGCTFTLDGALLLKPPNFVVVVEGREAAPSDQPPTHNAEVVARMLEVVRPLLVEMGFHQATVNPSAAGTIEGEVGQRQFVYDFAERLGIQLPAEAFAELVRLAIIGHEFEGEIR